MSRVIFSWLFFAMMTLAPGCKPPVSAEGVAKKWCALERAAASMPANSTEKRAAEAMLKNFIEDIQFKYQHDQEFYLEILGVHAACGEKP